MVSPLNSVIAGGRASPNVGAQIADQLRTQAVTNSQLQSQALQREAMQQQMDQRQQAMTAEQSLGAARYVNALGKQLLATPEEQWGMILEPNLPQLQSIGYTPDILRNMTKEQVAGVVAQTEPLLQDPTVGATASQRERELLLNDLGSSDEKRRDSAAIALGLQGRATGAAPDIVMIGGVPHMFDKQNRKLEPIEIEGQKVTPESIAKSESEIKSAVTEAVQNAKNLAASTKEDKSNQKALNVYDTAMTGLVQGLSGTETGLAGWLPAVGTDSRVAEGAISAMAPVLKQLFRSAGEGTFTDKDQELLLQMVPTRKDTPEARDAKIKNIDAIVRAKLGTAGKAPTQVLRFDAQGNPIQ